MRREYTTYYQENPEVEKKDSYIFAYKIRLKYYGRKFRKLLVGSQKWHKIQHELAHKSDINYHSKLRTLFYQITMNLSDDSLYVMPNVTLSYPHNITIGQEVTINRNVTITARAKIVIGNYVLISNNVVINSGSHTFEEKKAIRKQDHKIAPIIIMDDVWIGCNCCIMPGVTIGRGAIIGANSLVTHSIPEYTVYGGVPAVLIKNRF